MTVSARMGASKDAAAPVPVSSGYPAVGPSVLLYGPTSDQACLERFFYDQRNERSWGLDSKTASCAIPQPTEAALARSGAAVAVLTIATRSACLVWDVAHGGVPARLREFLDDAAARKCRVSADGLAQSMRESTGVCIAGLLELRRLHAAAHPHATEVPHLFDCSRRVAGPHLAALQAHVHAAWLA